MLESGQSPQPLVDWNPKTKESEFRCGNNKFSDPVWDFRGYVDAVHWSAKMFQLDFTAWDDRPLMQKTLKQYMVSELLHVTFSSARRKFDGFARLGMFLQNHSRIESFEDFTLETVQAYFQYLLTTQSVRGKLLSGQSIKKSAQVLKEILIRGSIRGWDVLKDTTFVAPLYDEVIIRNRRVKQETKFGETAKELPSNETVDKIIRCAEEALTRETLDEVLIGASILLQSQLGLRIHAVLELEEGCLRAINGEMRILVSSRKTEKEPVKKLLPANELVVKAIRRLEEATRALRKESGLPFLFLVQDRVKGRKITIASYSNWTRNRIDPFIRRYNIVENGQFVNLTSHYFRHIFVTYALKGGMKIHDVAKLVDHASIRMTETYSHIEEEIRQRFVDVFSAENAIAGKHAMRLKERLASDNPFKGRTNVNLDKLRRAMKIQVLPHGMCLHHPMRNEPCEGDGVCRGCPNFITTKEFLPVHKARLAKVTEELNRSVDGPYADKLRSHQKWLQNIIMQLELQLGQAEVAVSKDG